jgi:hypothetical protein
MFDANMRYIKSGNRFFAELNSLDEDDKTDHGLSSGDVVLCYMVTAGHKNPTVIMMTEGKHIPVSCNTSRYSWFVYAGSPDGSGFIDDKVKAKALKIMKGEWDV